MESFPKFRSNKRHGMHFRHTPSDALTAVRLPDSSNDQMAMGYRTPASLDEALDRSHALSRTSSPTSSPQQAKTRTPLARSQSSNWWMEIQKSPTPKQQPRSRKTTDATIRTDATATQPAFESDAFAVHMPTTREPVFDSPVLRAKLSSPSKAQVDAYQTYKRKAQQVRERHHQEGVRVPSKIVSYDYACAQATFDHQTLQLDINPPSSPRAPTPAGSFPTSPPLPHQGWANPGYGPLGPRSISDSSHQIARKPVGLGTIKPNSSKTRYYQRGDAGTGATCSSSPPKAPTIRVRVKPKNQSHEPVQKESWWGLYNRSPQSSSAGTRTPSPTKDSFVFTSPSSRQVFGYTSNDITGTVAGAPTPTAAKVAKEKLPSKSTSRWAWLKGGSSPKATKSSPMKISTPTAIKQHAYIDPFVLHASPVNTQPNTPITSRPASPKKLHRTQAYLATEKGKFETGFAQIKSLTTLILKLVLVIYALVGLYFLLDAIREAVHAMGAPFRAMKAAGNHAWIAGAWLGRMLRIAWQKWGFKIAWRGWKGWRSWRRWW